MNFINHRSEYNRVFSLTSLLIQSYCFFAGDLNQPSRPPLPSYIVQIQRLTRFIPHWICDPSTRWPLWFSSMDSNNATISSPRSFFWIIIKIVVAKLCLVSEEHTKTKKIWKYDKTATRHRLIFGSSVFDKYWAAWNYLRIFIVYFINRNASRKKDIKMMTIDKRRQLVLKIRNGLLSFRNAFSPVRQTREQAKRGEARVEFSSLVTIIHEREIPNYEKLEEDKNRMGWQNVVIKHRKFGFDSPSGQVNTTFMKA